MLLYTSTSNPEHQVVLKIPKPPIEEPNKDLKSAMKEQFDQYSAEAIAQCRVSRLANEQEAQEGAPLGFEKAIRLPDGRLAIVMEYAPYGDLEFINAELKARQKDVLAYDILKDLVFKESAEVTHQDIKGPNILINKHGKAVLADWGTGNLVDIAPIPPVDNLIWRDPEVMRLANAAAVGPRRELKQLKEATDKIKTFAKSLSKEAKKAIASKLAPAPRTHGGASWPNP